MSQNPSLNLNKLLVVVTSLPNTETAKNLARALVDARMAACVQLMGGIQSIYRWEGKICEASETLLSAKTVADKWMHVSNFIKSHHPYDLPEVIAYAPEKYEAQYGKWVQAEVK